MRPFVTWTLAIALVVVRGEISRAAPQPEPARSRQEELQGLYADILSADGTQVDLHLRAAQNLAGRDAQGRIGVDLACVLLRRGDLKAFDALVARLAADRRLPMGGGARAALTVLRRLRDERASDRRAGPTSRPPASTTADIRLTDTPLDDALAQIGQTFATTIVGEPSDQRVTLNLRGVPIAHTLVAVAFQTGLAARRVGQTWYVGTAARLDGLLPQEGPLYAQPAENLAAAERRVPGRPSVPVTVDLDEVPLAEALRRLGDALGANVVAQRSTRRVSLHLRSVSAPAAFDAVASQLGLEVLHIFDIDFIAGHAVLASRFPALEIRTVSLHRTSAGDILDDVQEMADREALGLTRIEMDVANNQIILEGPRAGVDRVEKFLTGLDTAPRRMELNVTLASMNVTTSAPAPARRIRVLENRTSMVTLVVPPQKTGGLESQLSLELTPRLGKNGLVRLAIRWSMTSVKAGIVQDVTQGPVASVQATEGQTAVVPIPWPGGSPGDKLLLGLQPEP